MLKLILSVLLSSCALALTPCEPFGLRVYYGDIIVDQESAEKAVVYFNTKEPCQNSFVNVISSEGFKKILCDNNAVATSAAANYYTAYIHICRLTNIPFEDWFSYIAYGWASDQTDTPTPHKDLWVDISLIDPRQQDRPVKVVALADWGVIDVNIDIMTPITQDLKKALQDDGINAIMIAGDIAYDLDTDNGTIYEDFLQMMEQFSSQIPIFHVPALLFNTSFKLYGLEKQLATGLSFGSLFLLPFDPYNVIYGYSEGVSSLDALKTELANGVASGRFIVPCSHYPLICSGQSAQCYNQFLVLHDYFDAMLDSGVSLFVGAHTHSYERNYPYFRDHSFLTLESPYKSDGGYLLSVVEGVAGNDKSILQVMDQQKDYTAAYTVNETGFAVIDSTPESVSYSHFSTKQGFMDQFIINKPPKSAKPVKRVKLSLNIEQE